MEDKQTGEDGFRHAIVLLHGLCGATPELGPIPKALTKMGYTVSSLEIPGYSGNQLDSADPPSWEDWCDTVDAEISHLEETHDSVSLCGLSMGATLALATAIRRENILAVVALSPILRYDGWAVPWYEPLLEVAYFFGLRDWSYKDREPYGLRNIEMRRRVIKALEKGGGAEVGATAIPARQLHAGKKMMAFVRKSLKSIYSQLLVIHSIDDETSAPRNAETIINEVGSEIRKVLWLGDCYHIITFDNEREIVANEAARFITRAIHMHEKDINHRRFGYRAALKDRR